jgi:hypothetical protein
MRLYAEVIAVKKKMLASNCLNCMTGHHCVLYHINQWDGIVKLT